MPATLPRRSHPAVTAAPLIYVAEWNLRHARFWVSRYLGCPRAVFIKTNVKSFALDT